MTALMAAIQDFHFLRPWWLLGVIPATVLVLLLWQRRTSYGSWDKVISPHLLPHLMQGTITPQSHKPLLLLLGGLLLACLAMAGPTWQKLPQAVQKKVTAQVIVLDLSLSMYATDLAPSRLVRARMKLTDILQRSHEGLTALVAYAGTAHVVTPLTDDANTIQSMVASLAPDIMPIKGSDPVGAIKKALEVFKQAGVGEGRILLMTDSIPNNFVAELEPLLTSSISLSIMGIGTAEGSPIQMPDGTFVKDESGQIVIPKLNVDLLKQAARHLGGRFSTLSLSDEDLNYLLADSHLLGGDDVKDTRREFDIWDESGPWLVVLLLPLAALGYRRGWLGVLWLPALSGALLLAQPRPAAAFEWQDLWQTRDQQAQQQLNSGDANAAAQTFENPAWKGSSFYRSGNYEAAEQAFSSQQDADGYYNLGNAMAQQNKFDEALDAYTKSLKLNPDNEDAKANADIVKQLKKQQQEQQQNSDQSDKNKKGDDNKQSDQQKSDQNQQDDQQQDKQDQQDQQQQDQQNQQDQAQQQQQDQEQNQAQNQDQQDQQKPQDEPQDQSQSADKNEPDQNNEDQKQATGQNQEQQEQKDGEEKPVAKLSPQELKQTEDQQALEQWLRRIPDDPGGLLRRKFQRETQLRKNPNDGDSTW